MGRTVAAISPFRLVFSGLLLASSASAQTYHRLVVASCPTEGYKAVSHSDCYNAAQQASGGYGWIIQHTGQRVYPTNDPPQARYLSNSGHPSDMRYPCGCFLNHRTMNNVFIYREILYNNRPDLGCKSDAYYGVICEVAAPTASPTLAPTTDAPWDIVFKNLEADIFEMTIDYEVGRGREARTYLLERDCETPVDEPLYALSTVRNESLGNVPYENLTLQYEFVPAELANSSVYNSTSSNVELCQRVDLVLPNTTQGELVVAEDVRNIDIFVDLNVEYEVDVDLDGAKISNVTDEVDFADALEVCQCSKEYECTSSELSPNDLLLMCFTIINPAVEVDELELMEITQGDESLEVVSDFEIQFPSITYFEANVAGRDLIVSTRVPINKFVFATGQEIAISGAMRLKLADGSRRELRAEPAAARELQKSPGESESAEYKLRVGLSGVEGEVVQDGEAVAFSSASRFAGAFKLCCAFFVYIVASSFVM